MGKPFLGLIQIDVLWRAAGGGNDEIVGLGNYTAKNLTDYRNCGQHHGTGIPEEHPHNRFFFVQYRSQHKMNPGFSADLFNVLPHRD